MEETTFAADPMRLMIAAAVGIIVLLVLIIKFKLHPVLSMMISVYYHRSRCRNRPYHRFPTR